MRWRDRKIGGGSERVQTKCATLIDRKPSFGWASDPTRKEQVQRGQRIGRVIRQWLGLPAEGRRLGQRSVEKGGLQVERIGNESLIRVGGTGWRDG